jgi:hypothetical protein
MGFNLAFKELKQGKTLSIVKLSVYVNTEICTNEMATQQEGEI